MEDKRFTDMGNRSSSLREGLGCHEYQGKSWRRAEAPSPSSFAKNLYFSQEKKFLRKVAELFVAFDLEKTTVRTDIGAVPEHLFISGADITASTMLPKVISEKNRDR